MKKCSSNIVLKLLMLVYCLFVYLFISATQLLYSREPYLAYQVTSLQVKSCKVQ